MSKRFTVQEDDKQLIIQNDLDLNIFIDYDDVWHEDVMRRAKQLCKILDEHWPT